MKVALSVLQWVARLAPLCQNACWHHYEAAPATVEVAPQGVLVEPPAAKEVGLADIHRHLRNIIAALRRTSRQPTPLRPALRSSQIPVQAARPSTRGFLRRCLRSDRQPWRPTRSLQHLGQDCHRHSARKSRRK